MAHGRDIPKIFNIKVIAAFVLHMFTAKPTHGAMENNPNAATYTFCAVMLEQIAKHSNLNVMRNVLRKCFLNAS